MSIKMSRLAILIGTWNTTGSVLATESGPASRLTATDTYRWLPGGHFMVHEADARFGDAPARSMEVIGYDAPRRRYVSRSYDDRGTSESFELSLVARRWRILGEAVRFDGRFSADHRTLTGLWESKSKRASWQPWIELRLQRA